RRLLAEVELPPERRREVLDDGGDVDQPGERLAALGLLREEREEPEVALDLLGRPRPLHLDHDARAVLEARAVHLADRAGRERRRLDALEHVLPGDAELLLHHLHDLGLRQRRDAVLEVRELVGDLRRDQVGPGGEDLAELAERRAELLEGCPQARRPGRRVLLGGLEGVLGDDRGDLRRPRGQVPARQLGHERLQGRRRFCRGSSAVFTITTVQRALCDTRLGTLPSRNSLRPLMPMLPTTRTSAFSAAAAETIAADGSSAAATRTPVPGPTARSA